MQWRAEEKCARISYRSFTNVSSDVDWEIKKYLPCADLARLCMTHRNACAYMREQNFLGTEADSKRFQETARCMLQDANEALRNIWNEYPDGTARLARGDDMLKLLGRVSEGATVTIVPFTSVFLGRSGARRVRVVANHLRRAVAQWNEDNPDDVLPIDFASSGRPLGDYLRRLDDGAFAWDVAEATDPPLRFGFEQFCLFEYVRYDKIFYSHEVSITLHVPTLNGVAPTPGFNRVAHHSVPLELFQSDAVRVYAALTVLFGFISADFEMEHINGPANFVHRVVYKANSALLNDSNALLGTLPLFYKDFEMDLRMRPVSDAAIEKWTPTAFVIQRGRMYSKRRKPS